MAQISLEEEFKKIAKGQSVLGDPSGEPAYLYCRSSDKKQAEEGRESLSRQLLFANERGKEVGLYITLEMVYWDIWTGKEVDRPQFYQMLDDVRADKKSDVVLIDMTDRLSRRKAVYYVLSYELEKHGLEPLFEDDEDELVRHIKLAFDELELERKRYRQIQANKSRAQKGYVISRFAPFGYRLTEDRKQYEIDKEQALWVRRIFEWIASGRAIAWVCRELAGKVKTARGNTAWRSSTISGMLKNEVYKGVYISNRYVHKTVWESGERKRIKILKPEDEWIYVDVPAIVSEELWETVQERLARNKELSLRHAKKYEWLLSGLLRCVCDHTFQCSRTRIKRALASGEVKENHYDYYRCTERHRATLGFGQRCDRRDIRKRILEGYVLEAIDMMFVNPALWQVSSDELEDESARWEEHVGFHQSKISEIDEQLENLLDVAVTTGSDSAKKLFAEKEAELAALRESHQRELRIAKQRLAGARNKVRRQDEVDRLIESYQRIGGIKNFPFDIKRQVLTSLIDVIVIDTNEQWFEIRGVLEGTFSFSDSQVVSVSARGCGRQALGGRSSG